MSHPEPCTTIRSNQSQEDLLNRKIHHCHFQNLKCISYQAPASTTRTSGLSAIAGTVDYAAFRPRSQLKRVPHRRPTQNQRWGLCPKMIDYRTLPNTPYNPARKSSIQCLRTQSGKLCIMNSCTPLLRTRHVNRLCSHEQLHPELGAATQCSEGSWLRKDI